MAINLIKQVQITHFEGEGDILTIRTEQRVKSTINNNNNNNIYTHHFISYTHIYIYIKQ